MDLANRFYWYLNLKVINDTQKISLIARAILKYGYANFQLEMLEYCDREKCIEREQYYMDLLSPEYNILKIAGSSLGYKHTEETIAKMGGVKSPEQLEKLKNTLKKFHS